MKLIHQVEALTRPYAAKGGKDNRRQQRARMMAFATHCAAHGAAEMGQVGARHVVSYWKASIALSGPTRYSHWLAIRELWRLSGKVGDPPRPHKPEELQVGGAAP